MAIVICLAFERWTGERLRFVVVVVVVVVLNIISFISVYVCLLYKNNAAFCEKFIY